MHSCAIHLWSRCSVILTHSFKWAEITTKVAHVILYKTQSNQITWHVCTMQTGAGKCTASTPTADHKGGAFWKRCGKHMRTWVFSSEFWCELVLTVWTPHLTKWHPYWMKIAAYTGRAFFGTVLQQKTDMNLIFYNISTPLRQHTAIAESHTLYQG